MNRLVLAAVLAVLPGAARPADPGPLAVELSRLAMPEENWSKMLKGGAEQVRQYVEASIAQQGATVPPEFSARVVEEYERMMPSYQEVVDMQAGLLVKHYAEGEIRELLAFYRTPLGRKAIRITPEVMADVNGQLSARMQERLPAMMQRLVAALQGMQAAQQDPAPAAAPASKPAAKQPAAR